MLDFVIDFIERMLKRGLILRAAMNYSEMDRIVRLDSGSVFGGEHVQIGDTINIASRIIDFAEDRELLVSAALIDWLNRIPLEDVGRFRENESYTTKHGQTLNTYTYDPPSESSLMYRPTSAAHDYKRFRYFPSPRWATVSRFHEIGLDYEIRNVISHSFDALHCLNSFSTILSWSQVLTVLTNVTYDPSDTVYILWRAERRSNFWTQSRAQKYIEHLKACAAQGDGYVNQVRIRVIRDLDQEMEQVEPGAVDIVNQILPLHRTSSFFQIWADYLTPCRTLDGLLFGVTISVKHKFAIVPVPAPESVGMDPLSPSGLAAGLRVYKGYSEGDGPMRAAIIADEKFVDTLIDEFEALRANSHVKRIR